jgi:glycerophosphoryl diester phosphodiesterase
MSSFPTRVRSPTRRPLDSAPRFPLSTVFWPLFPASCLLPPVYSPLASSTIPPFTRTAVNRRSEALPRMPRPIVIAHRGASGYLPEHSLASKALAHGMGADYLEQDVVLSRDGVPLVVHDLYLDEVTDAARRWPDRARADGRRYAIDFDLDELLTLGLSERIDPATGLARFPGRFPLLGPEVRGGWPFRLHTLDQELALVRGLNTSTGRQAGIYLELKEPAWHAAQGQDILAAVLPVLDRHGYRGPEDRVYIQCFEREPLRRLRSSGSRLPSIQLFAGPGPNDPNPFWTPEGLAEIGNYAVGIGPPIAHLLVEGQARPAPVERAHRQGLLVHPYTLRRDALPPGVPDFDTLIDLCVDGLGVDGFFTDFPDLAVRRLAKKIF